MPVGIAIILISFAQAAPDLDLLAVAASSPRPPECAPAAPNVSGTVWDRARSPELLRYCRSLARGYSKLRRSPEEALKAADLADATLRGHAAPSVLRGRALRLQAKFAEAHAAFDKARSLDRRSVQGPEALHDVSVAARMSGHTEAALAAYRALVPRADLLGDRLERHQMYVEAASVAMHLGPNGLDEAIGYLTEARRQGSPQGFSQFVVAMLALALDRQGRLDEARGVAAEVESPDHVLEVSGLATEQARASPFPETDRRLVPVLPQAELHALAALAAERQAPDLAVTHWRAYLGLVTTRQSPWIEHARAKVAALSRHGKGKP
jgi:tetratricopeptide (TPR) repeat protein